MRKHNLYSHLPESRFLKDFTVEGEHIVQLFETLKKDKFTGYMRYDLPSSNGILFFREGDMILGLQSSEE